MPTAVRPTAHADDQWILTRAGKILILDALDGQRMLTAEEAESLATHFGERHVLGYLEGVTGHWWTAELAAEFDEFEVDLPGLIFTDLRSTMATLDPITWNIAGRATQIADWYRDNQNCGRCGGVMELSETERTMSCAADGFTTYPRLSPAVIVLIEHPDGRALLARNIAWPMPMYSTLAGFVEPGESLEDCIHREVAEEVGVVVTDVRYFASQPWPFPNSLMLGFFALWQSGKIVPEAEEIADAQWFSRDELPMIPPHGSIARALIDDWLSRRSA